MQDLKKFSQIKLLVLDFDGVMTDGCVYVDQDGKETVKCSRKDGLGIEMLKKNGFDAVVVSKEINPVVSARCKKLKIECFQAIENSDKKLDIIKNISAQRNVPLDRIAYMGDDLNDIAVFGNVGLSIAVADAHEKLIVKADYITKRNGGHHAVREVCELILSNQEKDLSF